MCRSSRIFDYWRRFVPGYTGFFVPVNATLLAPPPSRPPRGRLAAAHMAGGRGGGNGEGARPGCSGPLRSVEVTNRPPPPTPSSARAWAAVWLAFPRGAGRHTHTQVTLRPNISSEASSLGILRSHPNRGGGVGGLSLLGVTQ